MTEVFELVLDGEPIGKGRPRFSRATGHAYTPEKSARFEERLAWAAQSVWHGKPLLAGALKLTVVAFLSIPKSKSASWKKGALDGTIRPLKKPDLDNIIKGIGDALNRVVYVDDTQIVEVDAAKFYSDQPRITIRIDSVS